MSPPSCAVIGGGAAGAAAALALARRGARVSVFEQFAFGHAKGASHGPTRMFRTAYFEHPDYVPLAIAAREGWRALERAAGETLYAETGVIEAGPPDGVLVAGVRGAAEAHGLDVGFLSAAEREARCPWLVLSPGDEAIIEMNAGVLYADKIIASQLRLAASMGAALHGDTRVSGWRRANGALMLETDKGDHAVDRIVVAAGPWARDLLGDAAPVTPVHKALFWIGAGERALSADAGFRPFAVETREGRLFYGFPAIDGDGLKGGEHTGGEMLGAAAARPPEALPEERRDFAGFLAAYAPSLPRRITKEATCLYEMSPDSDFMLGPLAGEPRVVFAAGLSGHGFKFAPVIGEALADLAMDRPLAPEFAFLDAGRFARG